MSAVDSNGLSPGVAPFAVIGRLKRRPHDRYELALDSRLPDCWAEHPGLIEELWALMLWRQEIYSVEQPSGQATRYWHTELRTVIATAASH